MDSLSGAIFTDRLREDGLKVQSFIGMVSNSTVVM